MLTYILTAMTIYYIHVFWKLEKSSYKDKSAFYEALVPFSLWIKYVNKKLDDLE